MTIVPLNLPWTSPHRKDVGPWITTFVLPGEINFFQPGSQWDRYPPQGGKMLKTFYCFFFTNELSVRCIQNNLLLTWLIEASLRYESPDKCPTFLPLSGHYNLWQFCFSNVMGLILNDLFLAPAVTVGERRELWILPPFFFGLFFCL